MGIHRGLGVTCTRCREGLELLLLLQKMSFQALQVTTAHARFCSSQSQMGTVVRSG